MKKYIPLLCVILAACMWGTTGSIVKIISSFGLSNFQIAMFRTFFCGLVLILFLAIFDRKKLKIAIKDLWIFIVTALVSEMLFNFCYYYAIEKTSIGLACVLMYTAPVFVTLMTRIFFKEKFNASKIVSLVLALAGCILVSGIVGSSTGFNAVGILLGIASGFCYATYTIFCKIALNKYSPLTFTAYVTLFAGIFAMPFANVWELPQKVLNPWYVIPMLIAFAVITNTIPYCLFSHALKTLNATTANVSATLEPVVATILGVIFFDETVGIISAIGIALILVSSFIANIDFSKFRKPKSTAR